MEAPVPDFEPCGIPAGDAERRKTGGREKFI